MQFQPLASQPTPPPIPRSIDASLLKEIQHATHDAAMLAATQANAFASKLAQDTLAAVESRLAAIDKPPMMVAAIQINDVVKTLPAPVSKQTARVLARMTINAKLGLNTMLIGPTGCGKTVLCGMLAKQLGLEFSHISWTEGMSEASALFARQFHDKTLEAQFSKTYRQGGVFLNDELDKANPNAAGKLNMALANGHFYNEVLHETITRHKDFVAVAACNAPWGGDAVYTATNRLSADCLNRFVLISVDYDEVFEKSVCPHEAMRKALQSARKKLRELKAEQIISTRTLEQAYLQFTAGVSMEEIFDSITKGWPEEIRMQSGMDDLPESQPAPPKPSPRESEPEDDTKSGTEASDYLPTVPGDAPTDGNADYKAVPNASGKSFRMEPRNTPADAAIKANNARIEALKAKLAESARRNQ